MDVMGMTKYLPVVAFGLSLATNEELPTYELKEGLFGRAAFELQSSGLARLPRTCSIST